MTALLPDHRKTLTLQSGFIVIASALAAFATLPLALAFEVIISPMFLDLDTRRMGIFGLLAKGLQTSVFPVFFMLLPMGSGALFVRLRFERQLNWPFWLIIAWALAGVVSIWVGFRIETGGTEGRLSDMEFAPLSIRLALHGFLLFANYSLMLLIVGGVFVTALERLLVSLRRD